MSTEVVLRSSGVVTTIMGVLNQFQAFTDLNTRSRFDTTLNKKYQVLTDILTPVKTPVMKYFGIGIRGYQNTDLNQSAIPYPGDARCMDLYSPIPFRVVPVDNDLDLVTRAAYRLRVVRTINNTDYACYYLKTIQFNNEIQIVQIDATTGEETPYEPDPDEWLSPTPPQLNLVGGNINANTNRIVVRAQGTCTITHEEVVEAMTILGNGDPSYARISELGYYTGNDIGFDSEGSRTETAPAYYEAAYVQLSTQHCFRGTELLTPGSYVTSKVNLESECCITSQNNSVN